MNCQDRLYRNLHPKQVTRRWQCFMVLPISGIAQRGRDTVKQ